MASSLSSLSFPRVAVLPLLERPRAGLVCEHYGAAGHQSSLSAAGREPSCRLLLGTVHQRSAHSDCPRHHRVAAADWHGGLWQVSEQRQREHLRQLGSAHMSYQLDARGGCTWLHLFLRRALTSTCSTRCPSRMTRTRTALGWPTLCSVRATPTRRMPCPPPVSQLQLHVLHGAVHVRQRAVLHVQPRHLQRTRTVLVPGPRYRHAEGEVYRGEHHRPVRVR